VLDELEALGQVTFRYAPGQNPNGSARDIAGVSNHAGNVVGLMPHPEHAVDPLTGSEDGLALFRSVVGATAALAA
jgi:phosphoribosylformylglycinamidine synthase